MISTNSEKRMLHTYAILFIGFWMIDFMLYPGTSKNIRSFISGVKWLLSAPPLIVGAGIFIYWLINLVCIFLKTKANAKIADISRIHKDQAIEIECIRKIEADDARREKEEKQNREREKRLIQEAEARARFHHVKQTRSADEAAKMSLEEF